MARPTKCQSCGYPVAWEKGRGWRHLDAEALAKGPHPIIPTRAEPVIEPLSDHDAAILHRAAQGISTGNVTERFALGNALIAAAERFLGGRDGD